MESETNIWRADTRQSQYAQFLHSNLSVKWDPSCSAKLLCTQSSVKYQMNFTAAAAQAVHRILSLPHHGEKALYEEK